MLVTRRRTECAGVACEHTLGRQPLHLYGYLWNKSEYVVDDDSGRFSFVVPDTVVFKHHKPIKWFFTSRQEKGKILVKSEKNVNVTQILDAFLETKYPTVSGRDCKSADAATNNEAIVATYVYPERSSSNGEFVMVLEHLTPTTLQQLLMEREKPPISVLQRFIPTRSGYNHLIQSVFTPDSCLLRKCVNSNLVNNMQFSLPERIATFEADERLVKPRDVTNRVIRDQIEHMHLEMSNHLKKIIGKPVTRNVAYFKHGADDRIYLLWSTMLSFETGSLAFAKNMRLSLSHQDRLQHLIAITSGSQPLADKARYATPSMSSTHSQMKTCPACRSSFPSFLVDFVATYKAVISAFQVEQPCRMARSGVPPVLESILPPVSGERFKELSSSKEFLYRTVALCQPCAKRINSTKKVPATTTRELKPMPHTAASNAGRDKPIYMQSARSVFWGKVEREEAVREKSEREAIFRSRPRSAVSVRPSPRTRVVTASRPQVVPNGLTRASLKCLVPNLADRSLNVKMVEPKHCMHILAEHLRHAFGGPSVRLALARVNIYPLTPQVSLEQLRWVADPRLLADVVAYWNDVSKTNDVNPTPGSIDLDSLDAMLTAYSDETSMSSRCGRLLHLQPNGGTIRNSDSIVQDSHERTLTSVAVPAPPTTRRPSSCGVTRPPSSRVSRLVHRPQAVLTVSKMQRASNDLESDGAHLNVHAERHAACFPIFLTRLIDGVMCNVHISAVEADDAFDLQIHAFRVCTAQAKAERFRSEPMELMLNARQVLELVARSSPSTTGGMQAPPTGAALVQTVLDGLAIQNDRILVRPAKSLSLPPGDATGIVADSSLTDEELHFLQETLRQY